MGQRLIYVTCIKYFGRKTSSCFTCDCEIYQENILGLDCKTLYKNLIT